MDKNKIVILGCVNNDVVAHIEKTVGEILGSEGQIVRLDDKVVFDYIESSKEAKKNVTVEEFINNPDNRREAEEKALALWNMVTRNDDVAKAPFITFQKSVIVNATTLSHKELGELLELFKLFGLIEYMEGTTYKFRFLFGNRVRLATLSNDVSAAVNLLTDAIACFKSAINGDTTLTDDEKSQMNKELEDSIARLTK